MTKSKGNGGWVALAIVGIIIYGVSRPPADPAAEAEAARVDTCKAVAFKAWQAGEDLRHGKITPARAAGIAREVQESKDRNGCL